MKNGIIYGGLIGLAFLIQSVVSFYIDVTVIKILATLLFIAAFIYLIVRGLKTIKKEKYNNQINYAQCLFNGIYIAGFAGVACGLASLLFLTTINTDYKAKHIEDYKKFLTEQKTNPKEVPALLKAEEENQDIRKITGMAFVFFSFATTVVVVIASSFIRNQDTFTGATSQS